MAGALMSERAYLAKKKKAADPTFDPKAPPEQQNKDSVFFTDLKFFDYTWSGRSLKEVNTKRKELNKASIYRRFVQPGRLVVFNFGPFFEGVGVIVDIIDRKRILVDGPRGVTGVPRHVTTTSRVRLTDICLQKCPRGCKEKKLKKLVEKEKLFEQWSQTTWAQKIRVRANKRNFTDFDRFKVQHARDKRSQLIRKFRKNESRKTSIQRMRHFKRKSEDMRGNIDRNLTHQTTTAGQSIHDVISTRNYWRPANKWMGGKKVREKERTEKKETRETNKENIVKKLSTK